MLFDRELFRIFMEEDSGGDYGGGGEGDVVDSGVSMGDGDDGGDGGEQPQEWYSDPKTLQGLSAFKDHYRSGDDFAQAVANLRRLESQAATNPQYRETLQAMLRGDYGQQQQQAAQQQAQQNQQQTGDPWRPFDPKDEEARGEYFNKFTRDPGESLAELLERDPRVAQKLQGMIQNHPMLRNMGQGINHLQQSQVRAAEAERAKGLPANLRALHSQGRLPIDVAEELAEAQKQSSQAASVVQERQTQNSNTARVNGARGGGGAKAPAGGSGKLGKNSGWKDITSATRRGVKA